MAGHGIVPGELAVLDEQSQGGGGEGLGVGCDGEERIRVDGCGRALPLHPVALGQHHPAVLDHGHGDAGDLELPSRALDVRFDGGERNRARGGCGAGGVGRHHQGQGEGDAAGA